MINVELFKKRTTYKDKDGNERHGFNFFLKCGETMIPIEPKYFPNPETKVDSRYAMRKEVLKSFATTLEEQN